GIGSGLLDAEDLHGPLEVGEVHLEIGEAMILHAHLEIESPGAEGEVGIVVDVTFARSDLGSPLFATVGGIGRAGVGAEDFGEVQFHLRLLRGRGLTASKPEGAGAGSEFGGIAAARLPAAGRSAAEFEVL